MQTLSIKNVKSILRLINKTTFRMNRNESIVPNKFSLSSVEFHETTEYL